MTTLDQLSPDSRAIIELILERGQSYADLSGALGMPESRVREHAREALASLAPRTAERVDAQWRAQVADYVLGQQSGPEAKATRSHLKSSEPARAWALSVLDSVGHLYPNGAEPSIPAGRGDGGERAGRQARVRPAVGTTGPAGDERADAASEQDAAAGGASRARPAPSSPTGRSSMSPEARAHVRRRRIAAAVAAAVVLLAAILLATQLFGGDDEGTEDAATDTAAGTEPELLYRIPLQPVGDTRGSGAAAIFNQQGQTAMLAQARLPEPPGGQTYGVWLFNDPDDAEAVPTQTDPQGALQAFGPLPPDFEEYSFVDVSLEEAGRGRQTHSGDSVLRGPLAGAEATGDELLPGGGGELPAPEAPPTPPEGG